MHPSEDARARRLATGAAYWVAAIAACAPVLAMAEWTLSVIAWASLALTWIFVESGRVPHLPDWITRHFIAIPIAVFMWLDLRERGTPLMGALMHLMCLITVAKAVKRKTPYDLWAILVASTVLMFVGALVALDVLYFVVWIAFTGAVTAFLNAIVLLPARTGRTLAVVTPEGMSIERRWLRVTLSTWTVVVLLAGLTFVFVPRDLRTIRSALGLRRSAERVAWGAGLMIPDAARSGAVETSTFDIGSLGSVVLDHTEAFEVRLTRDGEAFVAPREQLFLTGGIYDRFDGRRWTRSSSGEVRQKGGTYSDRPRQRKTTPDLTVHVKPLGEPVATLYLPRPVRSIDLPYVVADSFHGLRRPFPSNAPYSATGWWRPWDSPEGPGKAAPFEWFTELPWSPHKAEYERLAREITSGVPNRVHDRALAIAAWLSQNCEYTLELEWQSNSDPVQEFLKRRSGYCVYFASAMAVLVRSLGIPCRFVVGYAGGTYDAQRGAHVFKQSDAHAWIEIPYEKGWMPYDPTAGARIARPNVLAGWWTSVRGALERQALFYDSSRQAELYAQLGAFVVVASRSVTGWIAFAAFVALIVWLVRRASRRRAAVEETLLKRGPPVIPTHPTIAWYADMLGALKRAGVERDVSVTPREFVASVERARGTAVAAPAAAITEMFEDERYGGRPADRAAAQRALAELETALRGAP